MSKTIFITGGSTGIGAASVKKFISQGWNVGFMDINTEAASDLLEKLDCPEHLLFIEGNTRVRSDIRKAVEKTVSKFGQLNSVFANAGIHRANTLLDIADEELDLMIQTNIYGTVNTLREAIPNIIKAGGGSVVDLGPKNIRVNAVCAGTIRTPLVDNLFEQFASVNNCTIDDYWRQENSLYARGSAGYPEEVAEMVYFLASDASSFCTGGHYLVDGGLVAG